MHLTALVDQVPLTVIADISINRQHDQVLFTWRLHDETTLLADLLQHALRLGRIGGFEENTSNGEITWSAQLFTLFGLPATAKPVPLTRLPDQAHADDVTAIGRFLRTLLHHHRPASTTFRLQRSDGTARHMRIVAEPVLSADAQLLSIRGAYQDVSSQHWTEVALAATRDQLTHTEHQAAEHNRLALQLQHAIMPPTQTPIDIPGLRIAVRYRPSEEDHLVGGDWYDAVTLPSQQILLVVGDIAGHGIQAATGMVVLRNALRGLAVTGAGPAQLISWLNTVTYHLTDHVTATAICGLFDPQTRVLRWARAGHPPPVLIRQQHAGTLRTTSGVLLGAIADMDYEEGRYQLEPGDTLLMYTDGLIERKDSTFEDSQRQLLAAAEASHITLDERLDHLLTHSNADTDDDTCLVGIQLD
jgi:serine phosphatase RsbU (regulator of sigma subunit)